MSKQDKLTPAEWEIMDAIWSLGERSSVRDVMEFQYPNGEKAYTTVQTIMNLLEKKHLLEREKIGLVNFYTPVHQREYMIRKETKSFISNVFRGPAPALANFLVAEEDLSLEDIRKIKQLLEEKENRLKDGV